MRSKLLSVGLTVGVGFLLVTNPVVVNAAATISGKDIKNESVTSKDIKNGSLKSKDFKAGQLPAGAQGPTGPAGPSNGYMHETVSDSTPIVSPGAASAEVNRIALPAGSYMVFFDSTPYTTAPNTANTNVACDIMRGATAVAEAFGGTVGGGFNGNVDFNGLIRLPVAADLVVRCHGDESTDWYRNRLTAIKVGTATGGVARPGPAGMTAAR